MDEKQKLYLSSGQFATASQLSYKALRLYHDQGLLLPAYVDRFTNYRYYKTEQLHTARLIRFLREIEMPLTEIKGVLAVVDSQPEEALKIVHRYLQSFESRLSAARRVVQNLESTIRNKEKPMAFKVETKTMPAMRVVCIEKHITVDQLDSFIRESCGKLNALVTVQKGKLVGEPFGIYHGPINQEDDGPIQVCWQFEGQIDDSDEIAVQELPDGSFAYADARGKDCNFPAILGAYDAVCEWIVSQKYQLVGSPREVWYSGPGAEAHMQIQWQYIES
jgi:DNA-binding transcriptional MerR regulator